jgi:Uma2 family endonuclease
MAAPAAIRKLPRKSPGPPPRKVWTVLDLYRKFGPIASERIRQDPPPGCGTVEDVIRLKDHEDRLYELVDGILVEKAVGFEESYVGGTILTLIRLFIVPRDLGLAVPADGAVRLDINLVRNPDVSFFTWDRLPGGWIPDDPIPLLVPDLAVEVISRGNTRKEMEDKLKEYFDKGVRLVWYVRPRTRVVDVYTVSDRFTRLTASMRLDGRDVLPGFSVLVGDLFAIPKRPATGKEEKKDGPKPGKADGRRGR